MGSSVGQKHILDLIMEHGDVDKDEKGFTFEEYLDDMFDEGDNFRFVSENLDLEVKLIKTEEAGYSEGTVFEDRVFEINQELFIQTTQSNSWADYYERGELMPASKTIKVVEVYEAI